MKQAKVTILGCGNSTGVPAIGNNWGKCDPNQPKNYRTRSSVAIQSETTTIVIDTGPDFRHQINRENIHPIDAILYTHCHGDHVNGMDELRVIRFQNQRLVPIYGNAETLTDLEQRFHYMFKGGKTDLYPVMLEPQIIEKNTYSQPFSIGDIIIIPYEQDHGTIMSLGYRFGDTAYSLDMVNLNSQAIQTLKGIKNWIVDAAAYHQPNNKVHASIDKIIELNKKIGAKKIWLSSLSLDMDYSTLCKELPLNIRPSYDGLKINVTL